MKLKILLPTEVFLEKKVRKIIAEAENGFFCLKPRHVDFVSILVPGIFMIEDEVGKEEFYALNEGILVKCSSEVFVSTKNAMGGTDLELLKEAVEKEFARLNEQEQLARSVLSKLEADTIRRFLELGGRMHERII